MEYASNNGALDNGGFDLDKERDAATERMMARIGQLSNDLKTAAAQRNNGGGGGGPASSMDILSHYSSTNQDQDGDEFRALEQRARDHQYQYQNRATFRCRVRIVQSETMRMDYVQECGQGPYGADKLCVGCMGRRLKNEVGTNLSTIQQNLIPLQQAQPGGIMGGSFCQMFRQDNYRR
ncbi:hypothetical protein FRACYDRAFT_254515 [Fragilariopsis cylindrus CCMP1102]|uniref:Uncharacterized protein n=1 Tax=Fragilariopsis cylindrus CCMP1102 TaxID=635003 RepID=A0A1E7EKU8_9STRA|nr:hypothetical protein FRACYDRAFT_254515 [Fragilariopsis cylindrus CCMP1102]|eukprot:OEU06495.1 hypothetical protein FRACYDRAFT_254515 [Fragilariopsis cylindrus CCMP1102]